MCAVPMDSSQGVDDVRARQRPGRPSAPLGRRLSLVARRGGGHGSSSIRIDIRVSWSRRGRSTSSTSHAEHAGQRTTMPGQRR